MVNLDDGPDWTEEEGPTFMELTSGDIGGNVPERMSSCSVTSVFASIPRWIQNVTSEV